MQNQVLKQGFSLKEVCKAKLKSQFEQLSAQLGSQISFILVLDARTLKLISSFMKMMELMELNILAVEALDSVRKSYQKQHCIYFLQPSEESVHFLLEDFPDKKNYKYGIVHIFFTSAIGNLLMDKIAKKSILLEKIQTFKEINLDFACKFDNIFSFEQQNAIKTLYGFNQNQTSQMQIQSSTSKLFSLVSTLEKLYSVEIIYNKSSNLISQKISQGLQIQLENLLETYKKESSPILDQAAGKVFILILDRSFDILSPVLRDFHYQPMVYDLLSPKNDVLNYELTDQQGKKTPKSTMLSDTDELFLKYRFKHIAETMDGISAEFKKFVDSNTTAKVQKGQLTDLNFSTMSSIIKQMPQYQELMQKYAMHMQFIEIAWSKFEEKDLTSLGELELSLATGISDNGDSIKLSKLIPIIDQKLNHPKLDLSDKLRLIIIASICQDIKQEDLGTLLSVLPQKQQQILKNLVFLKNNQSQAKEKKSKPKVDENLKKAAKNKLQKTALILSRYSTQLEILLEQLLESYLKNGNFQFNTDKYANIQINCSQQSNVKQGAASLRKKNKLLQIMGGDDQEQSNITASISKLIIYVSGGISYSEIRSVYDVQNLQENLAVIIGGDCILTQNDFVEKISQINE